LLLAIREIWEVSLVSQGNMGSVPSFPREIWEVSLVSRSDRGACAVLQLLILKRRVTDSPDPTHGMPRQAIKRGPDRQAMHDAVVPVAD